MRQETARANQDVLVHLRRARDLADREYAHVVDLDRLAAAAGLSKYHFLRLFRVTYGLTPAEYVSQRRIERAQDLLRATNLTVTEVCHAVGFSSLGSFSTRFRALVGESPSDFQRRYAASGAPHIPGCFVFMWGLAERAGSGAVPDPGSGAVPVPGSGAVPDPGSGAVPVPGSGAARESGSDARSAIEEKPAGPPAP